MWLTQQGMNLREDRERMYFCRGDADDVVAKTRTDRDGRFRFGDVAPGTWWVGPSARYRFGEEAAETDVASVATRFTLDEPLAPCASHAPP
jgi:hypothetical protein